MNEEFLPVMIPPLSIQPLVENAIKYGLEEMVDDCHIKITTYQQENDSLAIGFGNNGSFFEDQLLEKLQNSPQHAHGLGIGLLNINQRIKLLFGPEYGIQLYNEREYAIAAIHIPILRDEVTYPKLMIADDERIIREKISSLINWKAYDIQLVGLCKNGLEAYDTILDESPDIVLTDIRMPGMNGLELIQKISETDLDTKFIILSGYSEFEYAKQAMKYGVKHYLLKPCNEQQIIESIADPAKDCQNSQLIRYSLKRQFLTADNMCHNVLFSIINDTIYQKQPYDETIRKYEPYMDFHFTAYRLFYIYFLGAKLFGKKLLQFLDVYCTNIFLL